MFDVMMFLCELIQIFKGIVVCFYLWEVLIKFYYNDIIYIINFKL